MRAAPAGAATSHCRIVGHGFQNRQQRFAAQAGAVGRGNIADNDLADAFKTLRHHFHVRLHNSVAELAELLHILLVDHVAILLRRNTELIEQRADLEEGAEKCVALHAELQIAAVGGLAGNVEARQGEDANVLVDNLLARPDWKLLPRLLAFLVALPHKSSALLNAVQRIGVSECLGITAQNSGHVAQVAVDANTVLGRHHKVAGRRALLL